MPRCMSRSEFDHYGAVAEHIVILTLQQDRLALRKLREEGWIGDRPQSLTVVLARSENRIAVTLLHDPGRARKCVGVGNVIAMIVREGQIRNVRRCVAERRQLRE